MQTVLVIILPPSHLLTKRGVEKSPWGPSRSSISICLAGRVSRELHSEVKMKPTLMVLSLL